MPEIDHEFLARNAQLGKYGLHGGENGVVSAARTPADFLVGLKILLGQYWNRCRSHWSFLLIPFGLLSLPEFLRSLLRFPIA